MAPREHGAWGLLLQPLFCAAVLGRRWDWLFVPAAILVLTAFMMREPLLILARQRWTWKEPKIEAHDARRCLLWQLPVCAGLGAICVAFLPALPFLLLASVAATITVLATWMALRNRQRSVALQIVSSLCLTSMGLLAALVAARTLPDWAWLLCALLAAHAIGSILVVRTRLELRTGRKVQAIARWAWTYQVGMMFVAAGLAIANRWGLAAAVAVSILVSVFELLRLRSPAVLSEPLRRVGFRALTTSLGHSAVSVAVLW
jgi:hypothetical protein